LKTSSMSAACALAPPVICAAASAFAVAMTRVTESVLTMPEMSTSSTGVDGFESA
jgi:hypothetical protein